MSREGARLALDAPAKLNLALHVTGRRDDGYHLLDTLVVFAALADTLELTSAPAPQLAVEGPFAAALGVPEADNLVLRAAAALAPRLRRPPGFRLVKNLPVAAGIGGGSADAAAALRLLAATCDPRPAPHELAAIALRLGADVPMCLEAVALRARGVGEATEPLPGFPRLALVLVNPGVPVPTGPVFARRAGDFSAPLPDAGGLRDLADVLDYLKATSNDLEAAAIALQPAIGDVLGELAADPASRAARMSGSGATCVGFCEDMAAAEALAGRLRERRPAWWVAPTLTRTAPPQPVRSGG